MKGLNPFLLLCLVGMALGKDYRSRAESVPGVMSSNTVGMGNIWVSAEFRSYFQTSVIRAEYLETLVDAAYRDELSSELRLDETKLKRDLLFVPVLNGVVGLTNFMHFEGQSVPWNGSKIGVTRGRLKLTLPDDGSLRTFGFAASVDVTLSTEENVVTVQEETPAFEPIISFSGAMDVDLIRWNPSFPMKLYLNYSNLNDYRVHLSYSQHVMRAAWELKQYAHSFYLVGGAALYQEKATDVNPDPREDFYSPLYEFGFGYKKKVWGKRPFTLLVDVMFDPVSPAAFIDNERNRSPAVRLAVEWPLFYRETRSEALRTLIYAEQRGVLVQKDEKKSDKEKLGDMTIDALMQETEVRLLEEEGFGDLLNHSDDPMKRKKRERIVEELTGDEHYETRK